MVRGVTASARIRRSFYLSDGSRTAKNPDRLLVYPLHDQRRNPRNARDGSDHNSRVPPIMSRHRRWLHRKRVG